MSSCVGTGNDDAKNIHAEKVAIAGVNEDLIEPGRAAVTNRLRGGRRGSRRGAEDPEHECAECGVGCLHVWRGTSKRL
jgi:hypothetical protein